MNNESKNLKYIIGFFLVLSIIAAYYIGFMSAKLGLNAPFIAGTGAVAKNPSQPAQPKLIEELAMYNLKGDEVFVGNKDAQMVLVTFTDFQCPYCARFHPGLTALYKNNPGTKLVIKHFPLQGHIYAKEMAVMFECVAKNSGNENAIVFADKLFAKNLELQGQVTNKDALEIFTTFNSASQLDSCKQDNIISQKIIDSFNDGANLGIQGTPALYIMNTKTSKAVRINGALDQATLQTEFDKLK